MKNNRLSTITDQVTEKLRRGMMEGVWSKTLPGRKRLSEELGCSPWTVEEAVERLTKEGLLFSPGAGKKRQIVISDGMMRPRALRVVIFTYEENDRKTNYMLDILNKLNNAGHEAVFTEKSLYDLKMDVGRIARYVEQTIADAWVVMAGPREVLEWFATQKTPTLALFGRNNKSSLASIYLQKFESMIELADKLVDLGHRRIVLLTREERRKPTVAYLERCFIERLEELGITTGSYNLPDWGNSVKEFRKIMDSLFKHTPPTALIVDEPRLCVAVLQHLSRYRLTAPDNISLACADGSEAFDWCDPEITHITWDYKPVTNRVVKWADNIGRGKDDRRRKAVKVRLVIGGTIGPVNS